MGKSVPKFPQLPRGRAGISTLCQIPPVPSGVGRSHDGAFLQRWLPRTNVQCGFEVMRGPMGVKATCPPRSYLLLFFKTVVKGEMEVEEKHIYLGNINFSPGTPNWSSLSGICGAGMAEGLRRISLMTWFKFANQCILSADG